MVQMRVSGSELRFPESQWEAWVSEGRVPPDALIFSLRLTGGVWQRADSLELYRFFRKSGEEERREAGLSTPRAMPFDELSAVAFPRQGLSGTEMLLGVNLVVALFLMLAWRGDYTTRVFELAQEFYRLFVDRRIPVGFVATLFIHADLRHLMANMLTLAAAAAFAEYLYGRKVYLLYLLGGLAGAILSFAVKGRGPMSVGASGAIYALIGAFAGYVVRHYRHLPRWQRWKARRIYMPLVILAILPSIFNADWRAHIGGFLCGLLLALLMRPGNRGREMLLSSHAGDAPR